MKDGSDNFLWPYREIDAQKINSGEGFLDGLLRDAGNCSMFRLACQNSNFIKTTEWINFKFLSTNSIPQKS